MRESNVVCFFIGMAGSGKTSLISRMSRDLNQKKSSHFIINLDPASLNNNYSPNIDIRDTIDYNKVMEEYDLGPNGAIVTSLNLFSTRITQIKNLIRNNRKKINYTLIDTPGQIEIFTWSASGSLITETFSSDFSVSLLYVLDIPRTLSPLTFITNILYSCSIIYKTKLSSFLILNKKDSTSIDFLREWIYDFEAFDFALTSSDNYSSSFGRSLALILESFNQKIASLGCSAKRTNGTNLIIKHLVKIQKEFRLVFQKKIEKKLLGNFFLNSNIYNNNSNYICQSLLQFPSKIQNIKKSSDNDQTIEKNQYYETLEMLVLFQKESDILHSKNFGI
mmetsp:Transcript_40979/g.63962  ORF Transcript_40979/g.63962 Transcript_40979/m.63962 type:complete len:335 (+) Transcript_40979:43-1047(+)